MSLEMLSVRGREVVDASGRPVLLRGVGVGGWLNMENFINGYPGAEHTLRHRAKEILGPSRAEFLFERWLHHFFRPDDVAFVASLGLNAIRIPVNYRHLEADERPFEYLEAGFRRLDEAISWCEQHGVYAIIDLHAAPGWQSTDWHSDNASRVSLLWEHPHFQERTERLWIEIAERYRDNHTVAAYDLLNEPLSGMRRGRLDTHDLSLDWEKINALYRRLVKAIRAVDPDHIIVLEGDYFAGRFAGFEPPFAPNLVYSNHPYTPAGFGPGAYPGEFGGARWDLEHQRRWWSERQGVRFAQDHSVPLWAGEFGSVYNGPPGENPDRLRALDDQITVFEETGTHWTTWTLKDVGVMGLAVLDPESPFMRLAAPTLRAKQELASDYWMGWMPATEATRLSDALADLVRETAGESAADPNAVRSFVRQAALDNFAGQFLQPGFLRAFSALDEAGVNEVMSSFALARCRVNDGLAEVLARHSGKGRA